MTDKQTTVPPELAHLLATSAPEGYERARARDSQGGRSSIVIHRPSHPFISPSCGERKTHLVSEKHSLDSLEGHDDPCRVSDPVQIEIVTDEDKICQQKRMLYSFPCHPSHLGCLGCIKRWLMKKENCPFCRRRVTESFLDAAFENQLCMDRDAPPIVENAAVGRATKLLHRRRGKPSVQKTGALDGLQ